MTMETTMGETMRETFDRVISSYSRKQAIADGVLVDLMQPETINAVKEVGFKFPVAMTAAAWSGTIGLFGKWQTPETDDGHGEVLILPAGQDVQGRLRDVLGMLKQAIQRPGATMMVHFPVIVSRQRVMLKAICGPGDDMEPVITIMLPDED